MNKRFKKRSKTADSEVDAFPGECDSGLSHPSRNVLAALDERISDLERLNRGRRKKKNQINQNTCSSQRPNSVPSKTVSFSPYIRHGEDEDGPPERHVPRWKNKCRCCNTGKRRSTQTSSPCRQRFAVNKTNSSDREELCMSPNSMSDSSEFYTDVSYSPGPAKYYRDFSGSAGDHKHSWPSDSRSYQSDDYDLSSASAYYNKRFGWVHPCSRNSLVSYGTSDVSRSTSDELIRIRTNRLSHCLASENVLGHDSKIDRLLAKYSDYSYPRQQSPPMNYFPYKSSFLDTLVTGASKIDKSILSKLEFLNTSLSARRQRMVKNNYLSFSLPSSYMTIFSSKCKDFAQPSECNYNRSTNCANDPCMYQLLVSNPCSNDSMLANKGFKTYRNDYPIPPAPANAASDSKVKAQFNRWIKPWFEKQSSAFQSKYTSLYTGRPLGVSSILPRRPLSILDDVKLHDRFYTILCHTTTPRPVGQPSKSSLKFPGDSQECKQSNFTSKPYHGNSTAKYNPHEKLEADSVFNYNLSSNRSVGSNLVPQPHQSTNDIGRRLTSTTKASRANLGSNLQSLDSIFAASIKNCATNSGYTSLLKFEKSYLDKFDLPNTHLDKSDTLLQPIKSETQTQNPNWNGDSNETLKMNFGVKTLK